MAIEIDNRPLEYAKYVNIVLQRLRASTDLNPLDGYVNRQSKSVIKLTCTVIPGN